VRPERQPEPSDLPQDDAPHLLVVDDDSRIRSLLTRFLGSNGFRVTAAESAEEARRQLASLAFDLLVVDVMMPGESGLEFTEALRQKSQVPILMLTGPLGNPQPHPRPGDRRRRLPRQAFEPRELLLRITNILKRGDPRRPR
jgi:two-component system phosphate regulon response regulator OmpR